MAQFFRAAPNPPLFETLQAGTIGFRGSRAYANYWGRDKRYIVDGQSVDDNAQLKINFPGRLSLALEFSQRQFTDIPMDEVAIKFHELFQLPQDRRLIVRRNGTRITIPDYGLEITEKDLFEPISEQIGIKMEQLVDVGSRTRMALALQMSQENSKYSPIKKGARDFGLQVGVRKLLDFGYAYSLVNGMFFDQNKDVEIYLRSRQISLLTGVGLPVQGYGDVLIQTLVSESPYRDIGQLSKAAYEIHIGYRHEIDELIYEVGFIENVLWPFNTPDWGFSFGISYNLAESAGLVL